MGNSNVKNQVTKATADEIFLWDVVFFTTCLLIAYFRKIYLYDFFPLKKKISVTFILIVELH